MSKVRRTVTAGGRDARGRPRAGPASGPRSGLGTSVPKPRTTRQLVRQLEGSLDEHGHLVPGHVRARFVAVCIPAHNARAVAVFAIGLRGEGSQPRTIQ